MTNKEIVEILISIPAREANSTLTINVKSHRTAVMLAHKFKDVINGVKTMMMCYRSGAHKEFWDSYASIRNTFDDDFEMSERVFDLLSSNVDYVKTIYGWSMTGLSNRMAKDEGAVVISFAANRIERHMVEIRFEKKTDTCLERAKSECFKALSDLSDYCGTISATPCRDFFTRNSDSYTYKRIAGEAKSYIGTELPLCSEKQALWVSRKMECPIEVASKLNKYQASEILDYFFNDEQMPGVDVVKFYRNVIDNLK